MAVDGRASAAGEVSAVKHRRSSPFRRREALEGYLLAMPAILGLLIFTLGPILYTFYLSFTEYNLVRSPEWIGLANYREMLFEDRFFWPTVRITMYYSLLSIPSTIVVSFLVAMLLNTKVAGIAFFRTIWYLPALVPAAAGAALWRWIMNDHFGLINNALMDLNFDPIGWLTDPRYTVISLAIIALWGGIGGTMLIFLAGLQGVPQSLYEAAELDGAGWWRRLMNITIPLMSPIIFFNLILGIIGSFQAFATVYLIFTPGGGAGEVGPSNSAMLYLVYLYRNTFNYFRVGYGAALAWVLFLIIVTITIIMFLLQRKWVFYETEGR